MSTMFKIFIGNVNFKTSEEDLRPFFEPHITIEDLVIARDPKTGRSMGYGFVMTRDKDKGQEAIRRIGKFLIDGRRIYLKESRGKKAKAAPRGSNRPFRDRRPRPQGQGSHPPRPFQQRRINGPTGQGFGPRPRPAAPPLPNRQPPIAPEVRTFPPAAPTGYVGLNDTNPGNSGNGGTPQN